MKMFGDRKETRYVKDRRGFWHIADVTFDKDGNPLDWATASVIDNRFYGGPLPSPDDYKRIADNLNKLYELPRVYETGVTLEVKS